MVHPLARVVPTRGRAPVTGRGSCRSLTGPPSTRHLPSSRTVISILRTELSRDLRDAAAGMAGRSSAARDLSLLLDRALEGARRVALRRAEVQTSWTLRKASRLAELRDRLR